ncbi:MAG: aspartyl protease family protein [Flavobacteriales bacterium]
MKSIAKLFVVACLLPFNAVNAQVIYSKDGVAMGDRSDFVKACVDGANASTINMNGIEINAERYCGCVCDLIIPRILSTDLMQAKTQDDILNVFFAGDNFALLMACVEDNVTVTSEFDFGQVGDNAFAHDIAVKTCAEEMKRSWGSDISMSEGQAESYCECMLMKFEERNIRFSDLDSLRAANDPGMIQIQLDCFSMFMEDSAEPMMDPPTEMAPLLAEDVQIHNRYDPAKIEGKNSSCKVSLVQDGGLWYLPLTINGLQDNFLFDTGAADLVMSRSLYDELVLAGEMGFADHMGQQYYELANGEHVWCDMVNARSVVIGNFIVHDVMIGVMDEGGMLCGISFFSKFKDWEWKPNKGVITLYR